MHIYVYFHSQIDAVQLKYIMQILIYVMSMQFLDIIFAISLTFTAGPVCLCGVSSPVVVLGLFVRLS